MDHTPHMIDEELDAVEQVLYSFIMAMAQLLAWAIALVAYLLGPSWRRSPQVGRLFRQVKTISHQTWWQLTSERSKRILETAAFWLLAIGLLLMAYTFASSECALRNECTFASAHWANWLFSK